MSDRPWVDRPYNDNGRIQIRKVNDRWLYWCPRCKRERATFTSPAQAYLFASKHACVTTPEPQVTTGRSRASWLQMIGVCGAMSVAMVALVAWGLSEMFGWPWR